MGLALAYLQWLGHKSLSEAGFNIVQDIASNGMSMQLRHELMRLNPLLPMIIHLVFQSVCF